MGENGWMATRLGRVEEVAAAVVPLGGVGAGAGGKPRRGRVWVAWVVCRRG
jgi:hypothetical protein